MSDRAREIADKNIPTVLGFNRELIVEAAAQIALFYAAEKTAALQAENERLRAEVTKWQRIRTPTHGPCCTCQKCGQHYDDCRCDLDEVVDELELTKTDLAALTAKMERDEKLIAAANKMRGTAIFGVDEYDAALRDWRGE